VTSSILNPKIASHIGNKKLNSSQRCYKIDCNPQESFTQGICTKNQCLKCIVPYQEDFSLFYFFFYIMHAHTCVHTYIHNIYIFWRWPPYGATIVCFIYNCVYGEYTYQSIKMLNCKLFTNKRQGHVPQWHHATPKSFQMARNCTKNEHLKCLVTYPKDFFSLPIFSIVPYLQKEGR